MTPQMAACAPSCSREGKLALVPSVRASQGAAEAAGMVVAVTLCAAARLSLILIEMNPTTDTSITSAEASSRAVSEARHPRRPCCRRRGLLSATIHLPCFVAASYFQLHFPIPSHPSALLSSSRPHPAACCSRQPWARSRELQRCSWACRANPWLSQRGPRGSAWWRAAAQTLPCLSLSTLPLLGANLVVV